MIRRGFWLGLGAVLGVTGYRRVTRLARTLAPAPREPRPAAGAGGRRVLAGAARAGHSTAEGVAFVRDVREGMAEYLDRQGQEAGAAPGSQQGQHGQQGQQGQHGQHGPPEPGSLPRDAAARRAAPRRPAP
ncbi:MAG TPA: hypothetical protein VIJ82_06600 [Streptosporangiaceae bacterium]|jgi:hypothetical protein